MAADHPPPSGSSGPPQIVQLFSHRRTGSHSGARIEALIRAFEARGATVRHTPGSNGVPPIEPDVTHVCVAGGDGAVRHVAGAIARAGHPVSMSIYPAGTINLLAREAGYPTDPEAFAELVLSSPPRRRHYPVTLNDGYFFACAGVGPDSLAVAQVSLPLKRRIGRLAYAVAFAQLLWRWPRHTIILEAEGRRLACEAFYVAKGRYYAGPWSFAPAARVEDPLLHVVALPRVRRRDYLRFVFGLLCGWEAERQAGVAVFSCRGLTATSDAPLPLQADGDLVGTLPAAMSVSENPLVFC